MKRPLMLLCGIIVSIILLSIIFPANPEKQDLITRIKNNKPQYGIPVETVKNYRIGDVLKIDDYGRALVWSLDEKKLYYSKKVKDEKGIEYEELWVSDLLGYKERVQTKYKFSNIKEAKWSPDGRMLSFISQLDDYVSGMYIYDSSDMSIMDITPKNVLDSGVTSYDWDSESSYIVMSVDIVKPRIDMYNIVSKKISKLDIKLKSCRDVAFNKDGGIIFSDKDEDSKYRIYSADRSGKNINYIIDGQDFLLSPDREKLAILSDSDSQQGLWIYDMITHQRKTITSSPVYNIYWLQNSMNFMFSTEEDSLRKYTYSGTIYYAENDLKTTNISGVIHTIFVPNRSGSKIALTSPEFIEDKIDNKGIFVGELIK